MGSLDTFIISMWLMNDTTISLNILIVENLTKSFFYYAHERLWFKSSITNSTIRHFIKPFTWRLIASLDTFVISSFLFNDISLGIKLSFFEIFTKIVLYYLHDKFWYLSKYRIIDDK